VLCCVLCCVLCAQCTEQASGQKCVRGVSSVRANERLFALGPNLNLHAPKSTCYRRSVVVVIFAHPSWRSNLMNRQQMGAKLLPAGAKKCRRQSREHARCLGRPIGKTNLCRIIFACLPSFGVANFPPDLLYLASTGSQKARRRPSRWA